MKQMICVMMAAASVSCSVGLKRNYASLAPAPMASASESREVVTERKLIRSGSMRLEVQEVTEAGAQVQQIVKSHRGYVESVSEGEQQRFELRVPSAQLEQSMQQLAALGKVTYRKVWVEDVTEEYIDVTAKLKNLKSLRERLRALYGKAAKVDEMLKIEKELARVQGEIDSIEGRYKAMQRDIAYSELSVTVEKARVPGPLGAIGKGTGWLWKKLWTLN